MQETGSAFFVVERNRDRDKMKCLCFKKWKEYAQPTNVSVPPPLVVYLGQVYKACSKESKTFWIEECEIIFLPLEAENIWQLISIIHLYLWSFSANLSVVDFRISFCKFDRNFWMKDKGQKCMEIEKKPVLIFKISL